MANVDLWGTAILIRCLKQQGKITEKEAHKILARIAVQTGADIVISF